MAARSSWKGFIKLNLISIPVKAYTANTSGKGEIHLNQIHAECHSRINYKKTCPVHGEVSNDAIVSGYEVSKGQFVVIDPEELNKLRSESDKAINIDAFISPDAIDPIYYNGKNYYLIPDGPVGQKPYVLLRQALEELNRHAICRVVMHGREQLVLLRPLGKLLIMTMLSYQSQVNSPAQFEPDVPDVEVSQEEMALIKQLIEAQTKKKLDYSAYKDDYTEKLTQLIEAKIEGKELVAPAPEEEAQVINLMEALKQSVAKARSAAAADEKPPKKMAKAKTAKAKTTRKRKTS
ncbi:MAG: non-homologous end joining protein Ku [Gemmatales bacterium]|nr:MAG: non-homologous end joining protein Ku [Gemmatales bacterium]